jgi:hypothetical protein
LLRELTTNEKGAIAEAAIAKAAAVLGIGAAKPLWDVAYDLILDLPTGLARVQCKWALVRGEVVEIRCRRCRRGPEGLIHRGYEDGEIDSIAAYCAELDRCFLLPHSLSVGRKAVHLRLAPTRNNQRRKVHWADDYDFGATLGGLGPIAQLGER